MERLTTISSLATDVCLLSKHSNLSSSGGLQSGWSAQPSRRRTLGRDLGKQLNIKSIQF